MSWCDAVGHAGEAPSEILPQGGVERMGCAPLRKAAGVLTQFTRLGVSDEVVGRWAVVRP